MSKPLTQDYLDARLTGAVREIISHFNQRQGTQTQQFNERFAEVDARFDQVDAKLAAIMEMLAMRQELRNLVRELKAKGVAIDESKVLVS